MRDLFGCCSFGGKVVIVKFEFLVGERLYVKIWGGIESLRLSFFVIREIGCSINGDRYFFSWGGCWSIE